MKKILVFQTKQLFKMCLQNIVLPTVYAFWQLVYRGKSKDLVVCADSHHSEIPFSMAYLYQMLLDRGYDVVVDVGNYSKMSFIVSTWRAIRFMKVYAQARVVFICDNFLPVVSCKKSPDTTVVQLMHSCGLGKKIGYDTTEDIPAGYKGYVYRNYSLVTVTSDACVEPIAHGMRCDKSIVQAIGSSRTDFYYDPCWVQKCKDNFYASYPHAKGKTILLWAPTFRGNAANPIQVGMEQIEALGAALGEQYFILRKVHPHVDSHYHLSNCDIPTEYLLAVADLMITDYSSIVVDYMLFDKPYVLFVPDLEEYTQTRGLYVDLTTLSPHLITDGKMLPEYILQALQQPHQEWVQKNREFHLSACDGKSTERILACLDL